MCSREDIVYQAKLAEQTERYEEMVKCMNSVAATNKGMNLEERNLLSVAYKNVIGAKRAAWRVITNLEAKDTKQHGEKYSPELLTKYKKEIEEELKQTCEEILKTLEEHLIPFADMINEQEEETKVFFYKMKGDYHRYIAEIECVYSEEQGSMMPDPNSKNAQDSEEAYNEAQKAATELAPTHPIRLGLALNFSVYYFEIKRNSVKACKFAKTAFDDAIAELDSLSEESYKDSTLIMQLLRDNLTLWSTEDKGDTVVQDIEQDD